MEDYRSNSIKSKMTVKTEEQTENHRVENVLSAPVKTKKKSGFKKLSELSVQEDAENVKTYILIDVLLPAFKKAISDVVTNGVDMLLYGGTKRSNSGTYGSKISYRSYYEDRREPRKSSFTRPVYDFDEILIPNRAEAEEVILRMVELIDVYGVARVGDFYELVGMTGNYTDNKYGWTDIGTAHVVRDRDGYIIKLPRPLPLD